MEALTWLNFPANKPLMNGKYLVTNRVVSGNGQCLFVSLAFYEPFTSKWFRYEPYGLTVKGEEITDTILGFIYPEITIYVPNFLFAVDEIG
jgi:hypothetical protein